MIKPLVVFIGGAARAGKNSLAELISKELRNRGCFADEMALAEPLKEELRTSLLVQQNVDIYNCTPEEKEKVRPLIVAHAKKKRDESNGRYWLEIANQKLLNSGADFVLVTDLRFDEFEKDELFWAKNEVKGLVFHISRFTWKKENGFWEREYIKPANEEEAKNDPKIKLGAHFALEWETGAPNPYLVDFAVEEILKYHKKYKKLK